MDELEKRIENNKKVEYLKGFEKQNYIEKKTPKIATLTFSCNLCKMLCAFYDFSGNLAAEIFA